MPGPWFEPRSRSQDKQAEKPIREGWLFCCLVDCWSGVFDAGHGIAHPGAAAQPPSPNAPRGAPQQLVTPRTRFRSPCGATAPFQLHAPAICHSLTVARSRETQTLQRTPRLETGKDRPFGGFRAADRPWCQFRQGGLCSTPIDTTLASSPFCRHPPLPLTRPLHRRQLEPGAGSKNLRRVSRSLIPCESGSLG